MFNKLITKHNKKIIFNSKNPHYEQDTLFVHYFHLYWPYKKREAFNSRMQSKIIDTHFDSITKFCTKLIQRHFPKLANKHIKFNYRIFELLFGPAFSSKSNTDAYLFLEHPRDAYRVLTSNQKTADAILSKYTQARRSVNASSKKVQLVQTTDMRYLPGTNPLDYRFCTTVAGPNLEIIKAQAASNHANIIIGKKIRQINGEICYLGTAVFDPKVISKIQI